ncbi:MAG TPA: HAD-IIIA family hydrolase [Solirubrobacteraceae bacterium]|nr:HAD-IIIA family hydrolase [Solirubrobacteraceae bacterium]
MAEGQFRPDTVFLDRDGVINRKAPEGSYVTRWEEFEFLPGSLDALRELAEAGIGVIVVTNQRGIARGRLSEADLAGIHARMLAAVDSTGGRIAAIYHCPHEGGCHCRKPAPGMLRRAAAELGFELERTAMIGDRTHDMEAAAAVGAMQVLVGDEERDPPPVTHAAPDLLAATRWLTGLAARG